MTVLFYTFGCKVNQYETEAMRSLMTASGYDTVSGDGTASCDVAVINSCTVTGESDRKLRQLLRRCRRENPDAVIVLTGCMPQAFPDIAGRYAEVDIVLGNACRSELPEVVAEFLRTHQRILRITPHSAVYEPLKIDSFAEHTRAFVKIQDGCNRFCSYCIIPYARGRVRSRPAEDLRRELTDLAEKGFREAVLVGINLTAYGQDNGTSIADAVEVACGVDGIDRVRLGSLEPDFMTDEVLSRLAAQPKLCPQFHVALQSGCDATLRRMNRHYTAAEFAALCERLRRMFPGCALTTDVMVGFPGEDEAEFAASLEFVRQIGFARIHVFAYSRRPGTPADRMPGQVSRAVKAERSARMIAAGRETAAAYADGYIGRTVPVLLETVREDGLVTGHTDTMVDVLVRTDLPGGSMPSVRITARTEDTLIGEIV